MSFGKRIKNIKAVRIDALRIHFHLTNQMSGFVCFLIKLCLPEHSQWMFHFSIYICWSPPLKHTTETEAASWLKNETENNSLFAGIRFSAQTHLTWCLCASLGSNCILFFSHLCMYLDFSCVRFENNKFCAIHWPSHYRLKFIFVWLLLRFHQSHANPVTLTAKSLRAMCSMALCVRMYLSVQVQ